MSQSLIGSEQAFALWAVLLGLSAFGFWCERYPWGRKYSGVMLLITAAIILANLRIIPTTAPTYDAVWNYLVPIAIPLLLFQANLKSIVVQSGPIMIAFTVGTAAVVLGVFTGVHFLDLGEFEPELAGIFAGTYIGGGLNFAAVAEATNMHNSTVLAAAVAADNVITNLHFLLILYIPGIAWMSSRFKTLHMDNAMHFKPVEEVRVHHVENLSVAELVAALALAFLIAAIGKEIANQMGTPQFAILVITAIALFIATLFPRHVGNLSGHKEAGAVLMYIFLASVGASADLWKLIDIAPILLLFATIIVLVHLIVLFSVGKILKLDLAELAMASVVCIGGPAGAAALASTKGWRDLMIPGVLAGSLGYAIGSFIGVAVFTRLS